MTTTHAQRTNPNLTLAVLALGGVAYALLQSLVAPALPEMQRALHTSESAISWVLTGYLLSASVATPVIGRLGDMFGKERMLAVILVVLAFGTLLAAVAPSVGVLVLARVIQGAGGGIFPLAFGIIRDEFPREKVAGSIGIVSALLGIGGGLGVVLAGLIVDNMSYHWLFWFPLIAIVVAIAATHLYVPESPIKSPGSINWSGALLMSFGLAGVLLAISEGNDWGWGSGRTLGLFAGGLILLVLWVRVELAAREPLVDMRMMQVRGVWTTNLVAFMLGVGMYSSFILLPQFVQLPESTGFGFGDTVTGAGLILLPCSAMMLVAGSFTGALERRYGSKPPLMAGTVFSAACFVLLALAHGSSATLYIASGLLGIGIGLAFASMANLIVQNVRQEQTGVATGMNTVTRTLGGAVGGQVAATILANSLAADGLPGEGGFTAAFWFCGAALILGLIVTLAIPGRRSSESPAGALAARPAES
ncbi:MFS transporter [Candidatus Solirubrobacter pratensis]|uniref:MFS transporter n=1 Tax=Candidatus Solirubrobacter pratensis TaxID=1298857 RepID=UPI000405C641|nr:MFS transporter [Candidatus Solirubrobacter pratensis]